LEHEKYIKIGTTFIWTVTSGSGNPVLLIAGGPGLCDYLEPIARILENNFFVIRFDQRGCGRSTRDGNYDILTTISDIQAIKGQYNIDKWVICGHSWGAAIALAYALEYSQYCRGLLYIAGHGAQNDRGWYDEFYKNPKQHPDPFPEFDFPMNKAVYEAGLESWSRYIQKSSFWLNIGRLTIPISFIQAGNDRRPNWPAQQLAQILPNTTYDEIPGAAHMLWLTNPVEFAKILINRITELNLSE
jgi:proline iminopeptidase